MYSVHVDHHRAVVFLSLRGVVEMTEMVAFIHQLMHLLPGAPARPLTLRFELRAFTPASPDVADLLRQAQTYALQHGVTRIAEVVESRATALRLNRETRDHRVQRFDSELLADRWLAGRDEPQQLPAVMAARVTEVRRTRTSP